MLLRSELSSRFRSMNFSMKSTAVTCSAWRASIRVNRPIPAPSSRIRLLLKVGKIERISGNSWSLISCAFESSNISWMLANWLCLTQYSFIFWRSSVCFFYIINVYIKLTNTVKYFLPGVAVMSNSQVSSLL